MSESKAGLLIEGDVGQALRKMATPMALGMVFMILVNIVDTFWVGRLGTDYVAAMTYTFPVVGLVINLALGLMIGTSTAVARAIGAGRSDTAARLTTHALLFAVVAVIILCMVGLLTQDALFRALGAEGEVLELTKEYMTIWYFGVVLLIVPIMANGALRAMGDAKTPMRVMMIGAIINAILDPLLIFGLGPFPALDLSGAAYATLVARFCGFLFVFYVLVKKTDLLQFKRLKWAELKCSARQIFSVGIPASITNALGPVAIALITAVVARYGESGLAAYGIGSRVDSLVMMIPFALGGALSPFIGQNWGAHLTVRVSDGIRRSIRFGLLWGLGGCLVMIIFGTYIARVFTDDPSVRADVTLYLQTIPIGYAFLAVASIASSSFNAVDRATRSTWLSLLRSIVLAVPAAFIGGHFLGLKGVFIGLVFASVSSAFLGIRWLRTLLRPDGEISPDIGRTLSKEQFTNLLANQETADALSSALASLTELEGMDIRQLSRGRVGLFVGRRELGHFHRSGRLDIPLPVEIGDNLANRGRVEAHHSHVRNGWYSADVRDTTQVQTAAWLLRMAHLLYSLSRRGEKDPITQREMEAFTASPRCIEAMRSATARWEHPERLKNP